MDDYEIEERKQAAADVLLHYSPFVITCIGEGVQPSQLRLHLMKELSGIPSTLKKEHQSIPTIVNDFAEKVDRPSSSSAVAESDHEV